MPDPIKYCLIKQPAGLGDILFLQKIAKKYSHDGFTVIWPVVEVYTWLADYITGIQFVNINGDFPHKDEYHATSLCEKRIVSDNLVVVCTDGCGNGMEIMKSKYAAAGLFWHNWQKYLTFDRKHDKEQQLYGSVNPQNEPYYVVSCCMGTPPHHLNRIKIPVNSDLKRIELDFVEGYTLLDWCMVLEKAQEIYIEGSAITYICEKLNLTANKMELFSRDGHKHFSGLFKKPWISKYDRISN